MVYRRIYVWKYFGLIRAPFNSTFFKFKQKKKWYQKPKSEKTKKNYWIKRTVFMFKSFVVFFFCSFNIRIQILKGRRRKTLFMFSVHCLTRSWVGDKVLVKPFEQRNTRMTIEQKRMLRNKISTNKKIEKRKRNVINEHDFYAFDNILFLIKSQEPESTLQ